MYGLKTYCVYDKYHILRIQISQYPSEISIFKTFLAKFQIFAYISLRISFFELDHDYDVTDVILGMLVPIWVCMEKADP